jgi:hypothetical protein
MSTFNTQSFGPRANSFDSICMKNQKYFSDFKKVDNGRSVKSQYLLNIEGRSFSKTLNTSLSISSKSLQSKRVNSTNHSFKEDQKRSKFSVKLSNFSSFIRTKQKKIKSMFERSKAHTHKENIASKFGSSKPYFHSNKYKKHLSHSSTSLNSFFSLPITHNNITCLYFDKKKTSSFQFESRSDSINLHKEIVEEKTLKTSNMQHHAINVCVVLFFKKNKVEYILL